MTTRFDGAVGKGRNKNGNFVAGSNLEDRPLVPEMPAQDRQILPRGDDPAAQLLRNLGEEMDDPIDLLIIHQGIIDPDDTVTPEKIIVSRLLSDVVPKSKPLEKVVKHIGPGRDDDIDQLHLDHVMDDLSHPAGDHGP
jgi:hypothetical protein